jgi:hypothetical protein
MRNFENLDFEKFKVIKRVPWEFLAKINFYMNITLHYHTNLDKIWWDNEKFILRKNN